MNSQRLKFPALHFQGISIITKIPEIILTARLSVRKILEEFSSHGTKHLLERD